MSSRTPFIDSPILSRRSLLGGLAATTAAGMLSLAAPAQGAPLALATAAPVLSGLPNEGSGFLFGMYCTKVADIAQLESVVTKPFDGVARYRDANAWTKWPLEKERVPYIERGNVMRFAIESRVFNYANYTPPAGVPAPTWSHTNPVDGEVYKGYRHVDFSSGKLDKLLDNIASGIRSHAGTFILDYDHEMDDNLHLLAGKSEQWGVITHNRSAAYTTPREPNPAEFIAAHRYIVTYLRSAGVKNALFGFCPAGWTLGFNATRLGALYPGNDYVDLIMWDPYNGKGTWRSFSDIVRPMYQAIDNGLFGPGSETKARFLGEYGCRSGDSRRAAWLRSMITEVQRFPKLRGGFWFSSGSWGSIHGSNGTAADRAALKDLVTSPYVDYKAASNIRLPWPGTRRPGIPLPPRSRF